MSHSTEQQTRHQRLHYHLYLGVFGSCKQIGVLLLERLVLLRPLSNKLLQMADAIGYYACSNKIEAS